MKRIGLLAALLWAVAARADAVPLDRLEPNEGQIMDVDRVTREITIQHGYLPELSMDAMSMVFVVADPALLERVRKGDCARFKAGLVNRRFGVLSIERIRVRRGP